MLTSMPCRGCGKMRWLMLPKKPADQKAAKERRCSACRAKADRQEKADGN